MPFIWRINQCFLSPRLETALVTRQTKPGLTVHSELGNQDEISFIVERSQLHREHEMQGQLPGRSAIERFSLSLKLERVCPAGYANHLKAESQTRYRRPHYELLKLPTSAFDAVSTPYHSIQKI